MKRMATVCALAILSGSLFAWQAAPQSSNAPTVHKKSVGKSQTRKKAASTPVAQPLPAQEMPPVPATLMNSAPVKPTVTMAAGLLTIDAPNSTLNDVLSGVRKVTGAVIEGPTPTERVVVKLGPGNPEQVLAALLRGTPYDYVILGVLGKPEALTRVMLTPQTSQVNASAASPQPPNEGGRSTGSPMLSPRQPDPDANPDRNPPDENAPPEAEEEQQPAQPAAQPQQPGQTQQPASDANQPKTPEQLFKELQQLNQPKQPQPQQQPAPQ